MQAEVLHYSCVKYDTYNHVHHSNLIIENCYWLMYMLYFLLVFCNMFLLLMYFFFKKRANSKQCAGWLKQQPCLSCVWCLFVATRGHVEWLLQTFYVCVRTPLDGHLTMKLPNSTILGMCPCVQVMLSCVCKACIWHGPWIQNMQRKLWKLNNKKTNNIILSKMRLN